MRFGERWFEIWEDAPGTKLIVVKEPAPRCSLVIVRCALTADPPGIRATFTLLSGADLGTETLQIPLMVKVWQKLPGKHCATAGYWTPFGSKSPWHSQASTATSMVHRRCAEGAWRPLWDEDSFRPHPPTCRRLPNDLHAQGGGELSCNCMTQFLYVILNILVDSCFPSSSLDSLFLWRPCRKDGVAEISYLQSLPPDEQADGRSDEVPSSSFSELEGGSGSSMDLWRCFKFLFFWGAWKPPGSLIRSKRICKCRPSVYFRMAQTPRGSMTRPGPETWISHCKARKRLSFSHTAADASSYLPIRIFSDAVCPTAQFRGLRYCQQTPKDIFSTNYCCVHNAGARQWKNDIYIYTFILYINISMYVAVYAVFSLHGFVKMLATIVWSSEKPRSLFSRPPPLIIFLDPFSWGNHRFSTCFCMFTPRCNHIFKTSDDLPIQHGDFPHLCKHTLIATCRVRRWRPLPSSPRQPGFLRSIAG